MYRYHMSSDWKETKDCKKIGNDVQYFAVILALIIFTSVHLSSTVILEMLTYVHPSCYSDSQTKHIDFYTSPDFNTSTHSLFSILLHVKNNKNGTTLYSRYILCAPTEWIAWRATI